MNVYTVRHSWMYIEHYMRYDHWNETNSPLMERLRQAIRRFRGHFIGLNGMRKERIFARGLLNGVKNVGDQHVPVGDSVVFLRRIDMGTSAAQLRAAL